MKGLLGLLEELEAAKVDLFLHQQALDTTSPAGRALFQMLGVFSEFERAMIRERVVAGLERAKAQGKTLGRPKVGKGVERKIERLRGEGKGILAIAKTSRMRDERGPACGRRADCPTNRVQLSIPPAICVRQDCLKICSSRMLTAAFPS